MDSKVKKENRLHHMTWIDIDNAFKTNPVILVPLGSMEEHGPQSLTGDYLASAALADRVAAISGAYSTPVIPFGYSEYFRGFPGTISFSPDTLTGVVTDICQSLMEHGITKIIFINGHAGNASILEAFARKMKREKKIMIGRLDTWQIMSPAFRKELYGDRMDAQGHGGEPVTSVMMHLFPEDIRMDYYQGHTVNHEWRGFNVSNLSKVKILDSEVTLPFDMEEMTTTGVLGDPLVSSAEIGEKIFNKLVDYGVEFVSKMQKCDMTI